MHTNDALRAATKLKVIQTVSAVVAVAGLVLLVMMVTVEDEPGALPLLLIVLGAGGYVWTRARLRAIRA